MWFCEPDRHVLFNFISGFMKELSNTHVLNVVVSGGRRGTGSRVQSSSGTEAWRWEGSSDRQLLFNFIVGS
jgi:hypothetical protein